MRSLDTEKYQSYLLRLWRIDDQGTPLWRARLESPLTGERQGFRDFDDMVCYLRQQLDVTGSQRAQTAPHLEQTG